MIGIDWGTTSLRAYRLGAHGEVLEERSAAKGILSVRPGQFPEVLTEQIAGWDERLIVMSGMVGSRQGWVEVPYANCPAGPDQFFSCTKQVAFEGRKVFIVPGLSCIHPSGVPDVMRGEETQLIGVLDGLPARAVVCLPGTHSKWASIEDGKIASFRTFFTGELFAVLQKHSLLGRMMEEGAPPHEGAFADGVARSGDDGGLLHHLFGVRTRGLFGELHGSQAASYLSGLLVGHELRTMPAGSIYLLGSTEMMDRYLRAAEYLGIEAKRLDPRAAARGLHRLGSAVTRT